jgi:hypothetical protein
LIIDLEVVKVILSNHVEKTTFAIDLFYPGIHRRLYIKVGNVTLLSFAERTFNDNVVSFTCNVALLRCVLEQPRKRALFEEHNKETELSRYSNKTIEYRPQYCCCISHGQPS